MCGKNHEHCFPLSTVSFFFFVCHFNYTPVFLDEQKTLSKLDLSGGVGINDNGALVKKEVYRKLSND